MFQIPWHLYNEEEVQEVLTSLYRKRGYEVYNLHKTDRRGEEGVDIECSRPGENGKILISVKKKPHQKDISQLETLAGKIAIARIYVYVEEPSTSFKTVMEKLKDKISFWNSKKLTYETFVTDPRFYLFMVIENYYERDVFDIIFSFCRFYIDFKDKGRTHGEVVNADINMMNLLWQAKDRSTSLHKSLRSLQELFEQMKLPDIDEKTKFSIVNAFLKSIALLHRDSLVPLREIFHELLKKYPANFEQFIEETYGRSNWKYFVKFLPELSTGYIIKSIEKEEKEAARFKEVMPDDELNLDEPGFSWILGDVSRILANEA
jgi:hypothetical protein